MKHYLKQFVTVAEFCSLKKAAKTTINNRINKGDIDVVLVGKSKTRMIDWDKFKNIRIDRTRIRNKKEEV